MVTMEPATAWLCEQLPELRRLLRGPASAHRRELLEQAVTAAAAGQPIGALITELGLDDDATGLTPRNGLPTPVDDVGSAPVRGHYVCPTGACPRYAARQAGEPRPACHVHEQALRFLADY
jgi:hypothetical protein